MIFGRKKCLLLCRVFDGILDFKNVEFLTGIITYFKILWQWTFVNKIAKLTRTEFVDVDWLKVVDLADVELSFVMRKRHRYQITFNPFNLFSSNSNTNYFVALHRIWRYFVAFSVKFKLLLFWKSPEFVILPFNYVKSFTALFRYLW